MSFIKKALVVDNNPINRYILHAFLKRNDYIVFEAENGLLAVQAYLAHQPDIIFMDVMMPIMNGLEACKQIKSLCGDRIFVPIIFVTAISDESKLTECIDAGGDDFIAKPLDLKVLSAKIKSMQRLHSLYQAHFFMADRIQHDQDIAKKVFNSVVLADSFNNKAIKTLLKPAQIFSGDMFLTAFSPSATEIHIMLADFTGHGLGAALGAIPASSIFKTMVTKGFSGEKILFEINAKLKKILPIGMFMTAQYIILRKELDYARICVCGMPDVFIRNYHNRQINYRVHSNYIPLGISSSCHLKVVFEKVPITIGDQIILCSDGVTEATNTTHELFGEQRLEAILNQQNCETVIELIETEIKNFCQYNPQSDDISVAEITCIPELFDLPEPKLVAIQKSIVDSSTFFTIPHTKSSNILLPYRHNDNQLSWHYRLTLVGKKLAEINPIPLLLDQLKELDNDLINRCELLYTILTELYINALDHGILNLDSQLKNTVDGFDLYYDEREKRLSQLNSGSISFRFKAKRVPQTGRLKIQITVEDSGKGFDIQGVLTRLEKTNDGFCGRGIFLVNSLCQSIAYCEPGNKVSVLYIH